MKKRIKNLAQSSAVYSMFKVQLLIVMLFIAACGQQGQAEPKFFDLKNDEIWIQLSNDEALLFNVELAVTGPQQQQGLMHRTELAEDGGMLFLFGEEKKRSFWMKNTLIPLDMLFLSKDGEIHHIHHSAKPRSLTNITSKRPSFAVLEINGGYSDVLGIKEGDRVLHPAFHNVKPQ